MLTVSIALQTDFEKVIDQEAPDFGELSVDYDEFVHKISGLSKSSTRQADVTLPISPQVPLTSVCMCF
jgi:alpha-D-ribose 1-methylphosphonate 5-phosphate C-P lyase